MRIAVTGASGYLGRNYISMYKDACDFVALTRDAAKAEKIKGIEYRECDYSTESLREALAGCDAVVHLAYAMATKDNEAAGLQAYDSSMAVTENVFRAALDLGITNMVFASSRLVYPSRSDEPFGEDGPLQPGTWYGKSKVMMEELAEELNASGARIKVLRFGQIIGANMKVKGMFHIFMEKAQSNEPLTLIGSDVRDYIHVKDACRAIAAAVDHPEESGIFNISMGCGTDNRAMAEGIISATGSSSEITVKETDGKKLPDRIVLDTRRAEELLSFSCEYDTINRIAKDVLKDREKQGQQ